MAKNIEPCSHLSLLKQSERRIEEMLKKKFSQRDQASGASGLQNVPRMNTEGLNSVLGSRGPMGGMGEPFGHHFDGPPPFHPPPQVPQGMPFGGPAPPYFDCPGPFGGQFAPPFHQPTPGFLPTGILPPMPVPAPFHSQQPMGGLPLFPGPDVTNKPPPLMQIKVGTDNKAMENPKSFTLDPQNRKIMETSMGAYIEYKKSLEITMRAKQSELEKELAAARALREELEKKEKAIRKRSRSRSPRRRKGRSEKSAEVEKLKHRREKIQRDIEERRRQRTNIGHNKPLSADVKELQRLQKIKEEVEAEERMRIREEIESKEKKKIEEELAAKREEERAERLKRERRKEEERLAKFKKDEEERIERKRREDEERKRKEKEADVRRIKELEAHKKKLVELEKQLKYEREELERKQKSTSGTSETKRSRSRSHSRSRSRDRRRRSRSRDRYNHSKSGNRHRSGSRNRADTSIIGDRAEKIEEKASVWEAIREVGHNKQTVHVPGNSEKDLTSPREFTRERDSDSHIVRKKEMDVPPVFSNFDGGSSEEERKIMEEIRKAEEEAKKRLEELQNRLLRSRTVNSTSNSLKITTSHSPEPENPVSCPLVVSPPPREVSSLKVTTSSSDQRTVSRESPRRKFVRPRSESVTPPGTPVEAYLKPNLSSTYTFDASSSKELYTSFPSSTSKAPIYDWSQQYSMASQSMVYPDTSVTSASQIPPSDDIKPVKENEVDPDYTILEQQEKELERKLAEIEKKLQASQYAPINVGSFVRKDKDWKKESTTKSKNSDAMNRNNYGRNRQRGIRSGEERNRDRKSRSRSRERGRRERKSRSRSRERVRADRPTSGRNINKEQFKKFNPIKLETRQISTNKNVVESLAVDSPEVPSASTREARRPTDTSQEPVIDTELQDMYINVLKKFNQQRQNL